MKKLYKWEQKIADFGDYLDGRPVLEIVLGSLVAAVLFCVVKWAAIVMLAE